MDNDASGVDVATIDLRRYAQRLVLDLGTRGTLRFLRIGLPTLNKIIEGNSVRRGTIALIRQAMNDSSPTAKRCG